MNEKKSYFSIVEFNGKVFVEQYDDNMNLIRTFYGFSNRKEAEEFLYFVRNFMHIKSEIKSWKEIYKKIKELEEKESLYPELKTFKTALSSALRLPEQIISEILEGIRDTLDGKTFDKDACLVLAYWLLGLPNSRNIYSTFENILERVTRSYKFIAYIKFKDYLERTKGFVHSYLSSITKGLFLKFEVPKEFKYRSIVKKTYVENAERYVKEFENFAKDYRITQILYNEDSESDSDFDFKKYWQEEKKVMEEILK